MGYVVYRQVLAKSVAPGSHLCVEHLSASHHKAWYLSLVIHHLVALVLTGAIGNMIDSIFYGLIFTGASPYYVSYLVPFGEGYAPVLMGKVVDMFRFPFFTYTWPEWFPFWGGQHGTFFDPVFNFADSCVSVGIISLLLFCRKELEALGGGDKEKKVKDSSFIETAEEKIKSQSQENKEDK